MSGFKEAKEAAKKQVSEYLIQPATEKVRHGIRLGCTGLIIVGILGLAVFGTSVVFNPGYPQETPIPRTSMPLTPLPDQNISTATSTPTTSHDSDPSTPTATATETPDTRRFCISGMYGHPTRLVKEPLPGDEYECVIKDGTLGWRKINK